MKTTTSIRKITLLLATILLVACASTQPAIPAEPTPTVEAPVTAAPPEDSSTDAAGATDTLLIRVGINAEFKPFVYRNESAQLTGFDIDLLNALSSTAGFETAFIDTPFKRIFDGLVNGDFDIAISAITITEERAQRVDFTDPYFEPGQAPVSYFNAGQGLAVRTDTTDLFGRENLTADVTVAVKQGTTGAAFVESETDAQAVAFPEASLALDALANGEVDGAVLDIAVISDYIKNNPQAGIRLTGGPITDEQYGIAVSKARPDLTALLNDGLAQLRANGTYDALLQKWFGAP